MTQKEFEQLKQQVEDLRKQLDELKVGDGLAALQKQLDDLKSSDGVTAIQNQVNDALADFGKLKEGVGTGMSEIRQLVGAWPETIQEHDAAIDELHGERDTVRQALQLVLAQSLVLSAICTQLWGNATTSDVKPLQNQLNGRTVVLNKMLEALASPIVNEALEPGGVQ